MLITGPMAYIGPTEVWIVVGVIVLIFGGAKIPALAKGLGEGIREFKKSVDGNDDGKPGDEDAASPKKSTDSAASSGETKSAT